MLQRELILGPEDSGYIDMIKRTMTAGVNYKAIHALLPLTAIVYIVRYEMRDPSSEISIIVKDYMMHDNHDLFKSSLIDLMNETYFKLLDSSKWGDALEPKEIVATELIDHHPDLAKYIKAVLNYIQYYDLNVLVSESRSVFDLTKTISSRFIGLMTDIETSLDVRKVITDIIMGDIWYDEEIVILKETGYVDQSFDETSFYMKNVKGMSETQYQSLVNRHRDELYETLELSLFMNLACKSYQFITPIILKYMKEKNTLRLDFKITTMDDMRKFILNNKDGFVEHFIGTVMGSYMKYVYEPNLSRTIDNNDECLKLLNGVTDSLESVEEFLKDDGFYEKMKRGYIEEMETFERSLLSRLNMKEFTNLINTGTFIDKIVTIEDFLFDIFRYTGTYEIENFVDMIELAYNDDILGHIKDILKDNNVYDVENIPGLGIYSDEGCESKVSSSDLVEIAVNNIMLIAASIILKDMTDEKLDHIDISSVRLASYFIRNAENCIIRTIKRGVSEATKNTAIDLFIQLITNYSETMLAIKFHDTYNGSDDEIYAEEYKRIVDAHNQCVISG